VTRTREARRGGNPKPRARRLLKIGVEAGLRTPRDWDRAIGISSETIRNWKTGRTDVSDANIERALPFLSARLRRTVTVEEICGESRS
jgi:hypothetical protein